MFHHRYLYQCLSILYSHTHRNTHTQSHIRPNIHINTHTQPKYKFHSLSEAGKPFKLQAIERETNFIVNTFTTISHIGLWHSEKYLLLHLLSHILRMYRRLFCHWLHPRKIEEDCGKTIVRSSTNYSIQTHSLSFHHLK